MYVEWVSGNQSDWLKHISNVERDDRRRPLATFIREVIGEEIRSGVIAPGERLIEEDLAAAFDVSRTPVREALRQLQVAGLVQSLHNRGFIVNDILEDVDIVFNVRARVEGYAAALAARRAGAAELEELRDIQTELAEAVAKGDANGAVELNSRFHEAVMKAARSDRLADLIENLRTDYVSYQVVSMYDEEQLRASIAEHEEIIEALWRRDSYAADLAIQSHINKGLNAYLRYLGETPKQDEEEYQ
ncbi:MAG: GntR family transcriptional regulator [Acidimicrobiia bacterium]|nr:GntR family transcriptional regulator [Acidimicrobiia bacterium]